jgi:hypothetical protein
MGWFYRANCFSSSQQRVVELSHYSELGQAHLRRVVEQRERKASSEWASLRRVRLHEPVRVVDAAGNPSILPITALHLFFANSTSSAIPFASII